MENKITPELKERFEAILYPCIAEWHSKEQTLQAMHAAYQMDRGAWVSVEDRVPENENWQRVCINGTPSVIPCAYSGSRWWQYGSYASSIPIVTHYNEFNDTPPRC